MAAIETPKESDGAQMKMPRIITPQKRTRTLVRMVETSEMAKLIRKWTKMMRTGRFRRRWRKTCRESKTTSEHWLKLKSLSDQFRSV